MARILFAWELGWHLSHLSNMAMIARPLAERGHEIAIAARELHGGPEFFSGIPLQYYQAPFKQGRAPELSNPLSYAHLLYTSGYENPRELTVLLSAWFGILRSFAPDVILFDHSPTALLASRALDVKRYVIGSGFLVPSTEPLLGMFPHTPTNPEVLEQLQGDEIIIRDLINRAVSPYGMEPLAKLVDLYQQVDGRFILSFPELDPFGARAGDEYYGVWPSHYSRQPQWPKGGKHHIFAYLNAFPGCERLLRELQSLDASVIIYAPGMAQDLKDTVAGDRLQFTEELLDLDAVAEDCDLFISHGAHTSVTRMLLHAVPQLMIPNYNEQLFTARKVNELGAGLIAERDREGYQDLIKQLLETKQFEESATAFAERHGNFDADAAVRRVIAQLEG